MVDYQEAKKGAKDAARGQVFTKLGNLIAIAARKGTDPDINFSLRLAIDKAKAVNMPLSNIERAIARVKDKAFEEVIEVTYEGYGPGGVGVIVECATNNLKRTYPEVKLAFNKCGGAIAEKGSVAYQFEQVGQIVTSKISEEQVLELLDFGVSDYFDESEHTILFTEYKSLKICTDKLTQLGIKIESAELIYKPKTTIEVDESTLPKVERLIDYLEDMDDVTNIFTNLS